MTATPRPSAIASAHSSGVETTAPTKAEFVDEHDPYASAVGARGIGEVGAVGVSAAIANAVHHATGVRVRELPITPEVLLVASR